MEDRKKKVKAQIKLEGRLPPPPYRSGVEFPVEKKKKISSGQGRAKKSL